MYLEFFGKPTVVINSQNVARELLEKRGAKYSDRPRMVTLVEMCVRCRGGQMLERYSLQLAQSRVRLGWNPTVSLLSYTPSMIKQRKWIHNIAGEEGALKKLDTLQQRETCVFLTGLMATPTDFVLHVKRYFDVFEHPASEAFSHQSHCVQACRRDSPRGRLWPPHNIFGRSIRDAHVPCDGGDYGDRSGRDNARRYLAHL